VIRHPRARDARAFGAARRAGAIRVRSPRSHDGPAAQRAGDIGFSPVHAFRRDRHLLPALDRALSNRLEFHSLLVMIDGAIRDHT